jgi:hypothetical protein
MVANGCNRPRTLVYCESLSLIVNHDSRLAKRDYHFAWPPTRLRIRLSLSQHPRRVDMRRATRWDPARERGDGDQDERGAGERNAIVRLETE